MNNRYSKNWTGNINSTYIMLGASNHTEKERQHQDYYTTEPRVMELLLAEEQFAPVIWECACKWLKNGKRIIVKGNL